MNEQRPTRPRSFDDIRDMELTPEEEAALEAEKSRAADLGYGSVLEMKKVEAARAAAGARGAPDAPDPLEAKAANPGLANDIPPWVVIPPGMRFPKNRQVGFIRFPSKWTTAHEKGLVHAGEEAVPSEYAGARYRQVILWSLTIADEKLARVAAKGDALATYPEMSKRMIRAIDGHLVDWSTGDVEVNEGHVPSFWEEIGPACRDMLVSHYHSTHRLTGDQLKHFFLCCVAVRTSVTG